MSRWGVRCRLVAIAIASCFVVPALGAGAAQASTSGWITMVSAAGDYVGLGSDSLFNTPATATIAGGAGRVVAQTGPAKDGDAGYTLTFAPPSGGSLSDGDYINAQRYPFEPADDPGIDVSGDGRGCDNEYGRFLIKDIAFDLSGDVTRFLAEYEQHCEGQGAPPLFGEVSFGEPPSTTPETPEPSAVDWPETPIGTTGIYVPVTIVAGADGAEVSSVAIGGDDPHDFVLGTDNCTNVALAAGESCQVPVAVHPTVFGNRSGELVITDVLGGVTTVPLTYRPLPQISAISPIAGLPAGGTSVTITGSQFFGVTGVSFGSVPAVSYTVDSPTQITAVAPSGTLDTSEDVSVTNAHGTWDGPGFTYADPPSPPTDVTATPGAGEASVDFEAPSSDGGTPITSYTATASPGGQETTGPPYTLNVTGLNNDATYQFAVTATNVVGTSPPAYSNEITTLKSTTTSMLTSAAPVFYGTKLDLEAQVTSTFPGSPTGNVDFSNFNGLISLGTAAVGASGDTSGGPDVLLNVGSSVTAQYLGDSAFGRSSTSFEPDIRPAVTATALTSSANPVSSGSSVTVTATVTNSSTSVMPFGSVEFTVNGNPVQSPIGLNSSGQASIALQLPDGAYRVEGQYVAGTPADFVDSNGAVEQTFGPGEPPSTSTTTTTTTSNTTTTSSTTTQGLAPPSSRFELSKPLVQAGGTILLYARSVDPGTFKFTVTVRGAHPLVYRRGSVDGGGGDKAAVLNIPPDRSAVAALARHGKLRLALTITFTSAFGGKPRTAVLDLTVRARRR